MQSHKQTSFVYFSEFYDPETVEMMEWVTNEIPQEKAFSGSMQLMAGVKLCTLHHVTNHPHFEDQALRAKTKDVCSKTAEILF